MVENRERDECLEIVPAPTRVRLEERGGVLRAVAEELPPLDAETVRAALEHARR